MEWLLIIHSLTWSSLFPFYHITGSVQYENVFRGTPLTTVYVVDEDAKALYMNTRPWSRYEILVLPTGIDNVEMEEDSRSIAGYYDLNGRQVSGKQRGPVFEIECINLCSEKNFVCRQYKRKNAQYEEIAVYAEKGKNLVQLSEITRHARHNAQVSKSLCSVRVTSKRLAGRGFSSFYLKETHSLPERSIMRMVRVLTKGMVWG